MKKIIILVGILLLAAGCGQGKKANQENKSDGSNKPNQSNESKQTQETQNFPQGEKEDWETYTDIGWKYEISYPKTFKLFTDSALIKNLAYIPPCDPFAVSCLFYSADHLENTNFEGAGISVEPQENSTTENKCRMARAGEKNIGELTINGLLFTVFEGSGVAAGHMESYKIYRTFGAIGCMEVTLRVTSANIWNYPKESNIKEFNSKEVWNKLEQVLSTFKFTETASSKEKMKVKVFVIAPEDNGQSGKLVGCGDSVVEIEKEVIKTTTPLREALAALLEMKGDYVGESGLYNSLARSNLKIEGVSIDKAGKATIKLSGELISGGVCDGPRIEAQIRETAMQFASVKSVEIFINNTLLSEIFIGKGQTVKVKVFFANYKKQKDPNSCNELFALEREVDKTSAVATAAITELLKGPSLEEKALGYTSGLPNGSKLKSLKIVNGIAYADFNQATDNTGGSCNPRAEQIKQTLMQFSTVKSVVLSIDGRTEGIFQP